MFRIASKYPKDPNTVRQIFQCWEPSILSVRQQNMTEPGTQSTREDPSIGVDSPDVPEEAQRDEARDRRSALRRIGKYSAYAVPAILALTHKTAAAYP